MGFESIAWCFADLVGDLDGAGADRPMRHATLSAYKVPRHRIPGTTVIAALKCVGNAKLKKSQKVLSPDHK